MATSHLFRLHGVGEISTKSARRVLDSVNDAYDGLMIFDSLRQQSIRELPRTVSRMVAVHHPIYSSEGDPIFLQLESIPGSLELKGVILQSPGFWEFLGALNPLETLLKFLNETLDVLRKAAVPEDEIAILVRDMLLIPTYGLESLQDLKVISNAEMPITNAEEIQEGANV
mgnify:CR=1 FL=1